MRQLILAMLWSLLSLSGLSAQAADEAGDFVAGKDYYVLETPVPAANPQKVSVQEIFWYACPHCYQFEPVLNPWVARLPADVDFQRLPALFGRLWDAHGRLFLTLQAMGAEARVHQAIFEAIHRGQHLATPEDMVAFLGSHGIDRQAFLDTYNSFAIQGNMGKIRQQLAAYQVSGVPCLIINGKYRVDTELAGGLPEMLKVADFLIARERASLAK